MNTLINILNFVGRFLASATPLLAIGGILFLVYGINISAEGIAKVGVALIFCALWSLIMCIATAAATVAIESVAKK